MLLLFHKAIIITVYFTNKMIVIMILLSNYFLFCKAFFPSTCLTRFSHNFCICLYLLYFPIQLSSSFLITVLFDSLKMH